MDLKKYYEVREEEDFSEIEEIKLETEYVSTSEIEVDSEWEAAMKQAPKSPGGASSIVSMAVHACPFADCNLFFPKLNRLTRHVRQVHSKERPYICQFPGCNSDYKRQAHLTLHIANVHEKAVYTCKECPKTYASQQALTKHNRTAHGPGSSRIKCAECGLTFHKRNMLYKHELAEHGKANQVHGCLKCPERFQEQHLLRRHVRKCHQILFCPECKVEFNSFAAVNLHVKQVHRTVHHCSVCKKDFKTRPALNEHAVIHKAERTVFHCTEEGCEKKFLHLRNLRHHISVSHKDGGIKCTFEGCDKTLTNFRSMKHHSDLHNKYGLNILSALEKEKFQKRKGNPLMPRRDKGTSKKPMASLLSAVHVAPSEARVLMRGKEVGLVAEDIETELEKDDQLREDFFDPVDVANEKESVETSEICRRKYSNVKKREKAEMSKESKPNGVE